MTNKFDERYDIRQAHIDEIDEIMNFIDSHWKKGHIMATNKELFKYEFVINDKVNFFIAKDRRTNSIEAILGFLPTSKELKDTWGSIWKLKPNNHNIPFLGIEVFDKLIKTIKPRNHIAVGANPKTATPILEALYSYISHKMNQYYRVSDKKEFKIAKIKNKKILFKDNSIKQLEPKIINSIDELKKVFNFETIKNAIPYKDSWYINKRFFNHPIYKYQVYASNDAVIITREQEARNTKILRIVDYLGKQEYFSHLYDFFEKKLDKYEYIDFYNFGFEEKYLAQAGFVKREDNDKNIIPNYFSPFVQENIEIYVLSKDRNCLFFKADADQDRPN